MPGVKKRKGGNRGLYKTGQYIVVSPREKSAATAGGTVYSQVVRGTLSSTAGGTRFRQIRSLDMPAVSRRRRKQRCNGPVESCAPNVSATGRLPPLVLYSRAHPDPP